MFRRTRFAPGTSGSGSGLRAGTFGVTGGAASIAGAPRTAPEVVRSTGVVTGASSPEEWLAGAPEQRGLKREREQAGELAGAQAEPVPAGGSDQLELDVGPERGAEERLRAPPVPGRGDRDDLRRPRLRASRATPRAFPAVVRASPSGTSGTSGPCHAAVISSASEGGGGGGAPSR